MRIDHKIIVDLIEHKSRVLDLGCGDGTLLATLKQKKDCRVAGVEIDEQAIYASIEKGLTVSQGDIDTGLTDYADKRFDYVILNESLQQVLHPQRVILEALRVGKKVVVGIPNFCHSKARWQIFFRGRVPVTKELPYEWFNTPNLRFLSLKDFRYFCRDNDITIHKEIGLNPDGIVKFRPNFWANLGIFLLEKQ